MLLCIDIGNTNIVLRRDRKGQGRQALAHQDGQRRHCRRTRHDITNLFEHSGVKPGDIKDIIITSVVPSLMKAMEEFSLRYFNVNPLIVGPG